MVAKRWHNIGGPILAVAVAPLLVDCGGGMPGVPGPPGGCEVDIANPQAIMDAQFGLDASIEGKLKAGLAAGANLQKLAVQIEGDVAAACGGLAKDLGASDEDIAPKEEGPGKKAEAACNAAVKMIGEVKAKAAGSLTVDVVPPKCSASMDAMADCAATCDANIEPGKAEVSCEGGEISGSCEAECNGTCTLEAGAECEGSCGGSCEGSCEADFSGTCEGKCDGKCDGKDSKAECKGTCEGKCEGTGKGKCGGTCKGKCDASCTMEAKGECKGSCSGECSVEMKAPKCSGEVMLIDGGKYSECWDESAGYVKALVSKEDWQKRLQGARQPLGKIVSREVKSTHYTTSAPGAPDGQYVIIQYETSFENKKTAVETVTPMVDTDGTWRVSGYYIR